MFRLVVGYSGPIGDLPADASSAAQLFVDSVAESLANATKRRSLDILVPNTA